MPLAAANKLLMTLPGHSAAVWRASDLGQADSVALASGHPLLDAQLPGGGWPAGAASEILQPVGVFLEWRLLLPALGRLTRSRPGVLVLIGPPHVPFGPGLCAQGLEARRLLWIRPAQAQERLWSCEQALRCADVLAVLAWLPQARPEHLRRLQLAAQSHAKFLFVMRSAQARDESSAALLRLLLEPASAAGQAVDHTADALRLHILKRRGPPLTQPLLLPARPARLAALLGLQRRPGADNNAQGLEHNHAVDRLTAAA
jgi:protein ImuA